MTEPTPMAVNRTLRRLPNAAYRSREYLTEAEVDRLIEAARKRARNSARDARKNQAVVTGVPASVMKTYGLLPWSGRRARSSGPRSG